MKNIILLLITLFISNYLAAQAPLPQKLVVYYMDGKVDTLNVFSGKISDDYYQFSTVQDNTQIGPSPHPITIKTSKIHSINYNGDIREVSGSYNEVENIRLCLEYHRKQKMNGVYTGIVGVGIISLGGIILHNTSTAQGANSANVITVIGTGTLMVGSIISIDANKWLKRTKVPNISRH